MSGNKNKLIAINHLGSKFSYLDELYAYFPNHLHFIEVFCGSAVVTLNKEPSKINTVNDINGNVINFFRVLRENPTQLIDALRLTPVSREEYNNCWYLDETMSDMEKARRFFVRSRQSYGGNGNERQSAGWELVTKRSNAKFGENISKWLNSIEKLYEIVSILRHLQIESKCFRQLIPVMDFKEAFFTWIHLIRKIVELLLMTICLILQMMIIEIWQKRPEQL